MNKEQRDRILHFTPLMDIMDIQGSKPFHTNVTGEHWEFVKFAFVGTPVVAIFPLVDQAFYIRERDAIVPAGIVQLIRKAGIGKFAVKEGECIIWHGNLERAPRGHASAKLRGRVASETLSSLHLSLYVSRVVE
jgi:hypothetical protein